MDKTLSDLSDAQPCSLISYSCFTENGRLTESLPGKYRSAAQQCLKLIERFASRLTESPEPLSVVTSPAKSMSLLPLLSSESELSAKTPHVRNTSTPQLIDHLPRVDDVACAEFEVLEENVFAQKKIGCSHQSLDMMVCECQYDPCECRDQNAVAA